ncbi:MAG: hypothetical protein ACLRFK_03080 [Alphaproteobacteria bacterium]
MSKTWTFVLGMATGIALSGLFVAGTAPTDSSVVTMLDEPGDCLTTSNLTVFQVLAPNMALAAIDSSFDSLLFLVTNDDGQIYYDAQVIKVPNKKCFRQIGTYKYKTKSQNMRTVPIVKIN